MPSSDPEQDLRPTHLAVGRHVRLLAQVRLATLVVALVSALVAGRTGPLGALLVALAVPFSLSPALSWARKGEVFSRSGILLACDLVTTVIALMVLPGDVMVVYAAATAALLGVVVGTRLSLVMCLPVAMTLVSVMHDGAASWYLVGVGTAGLAAMAWAGATLGATVRAQDAAAAAAAREQARRAATLERVRIARDLHDTAAGDLAGATMIGSALVRRLEREDVSERTLELARRLAETCREAHEDTRVALGELRRADATADDLAEVCGQWSARTGVQVRTDVDVAPGVVPGDLQADLRSVLLELLENVRRHAGATVVDVRLAVEADARLVVLTVTDDGKGFDRAPEARDVASGRFGLAGIDERVREHDGTVVRTRPEAGGARTVVTVPLAPAASVVGA